MLILTNPAQVDDLMGMQACNLQNLPENYSMKYCTSRTLIHTTRFLLRGKNCTLRLVPLIVLAWPVLRCGGPKGKDCWVHTGEDVRPGLLPVFPPTFLALMPRITPSDDTGRKISKTMKSHTDTLPLYQSCEGTDGWDWRRS